MVSTRTKQPETRRSDLMAAAWKVFEQKGVAKATVSDIVKAAGVAQGTFYLYFKTKTDVLNAMATRFAEDLVVALEKTVASHRGDAAQALKGLFRAIMHFAGDTAAWELAEIYHRPENRVVHERMAESLLSRLVPLVEGIVRQGVEEGVFAVSDPRLTAWFILGGLHAIEAACPQRETLAPALASATDSALRLLGYAGPGRPEQAWKGRHV